MSTQDMSGKICMITGATSGIGKATALGLAKKGANVVIVSRSQTRGEIVVKEIKTKSGSNSVELEIADFSSLGSVREMANRFISANEKVHILINNAGVFSVKKTQTHDGYETTFAVNHLAPFLLTNLLLGLLKKSSPARIVNVASSAHEGANMEFDNLQGEKHWSSFRAYPQSKLANILFTYELSKRLAGTGVTANCLHPGVVRTNLGKENSGALWLLYSIARIFFKSPERGAETSIFLASSSTVEGISGKYFSNKCEVKSSRESYDENTMARLWDVSKSLTGLKQDERS